MIDLDPAFILILGMCRGDSIIVNSAPIFLHLVSVPFDIEHWQVFSVLICLSDLIYRYDLGSISREYEWIELLDLISDLSVGIPESYSLCHSVSDPRDSSGGDRSFSLRQVKFSECLEIDSFRLRRDREVDLECR